VRTPGAFALADGPAPGARFAPLPAGALAQEGLERHARDLASWLHREMPHRVLQSRAPRMHSRPDEDEGAFRVRLREALHEARDREVEKLRGRYAPRVARLEERIRRAAARVEREEDQARGATLQAAISVGASVLGALLGRKLTSARSVGRATTAARGMGRAADQREDVARAEAELAELERKRAALEAELEERLAALQEAHREEALELKTLPVAPRKSDLAPEGFALVWRPASEGTAGAGAPLRAATSGAA